MKGLLIGLVLLMASPAWADDAGAVQEEVNVKVAYLGMGQFVFKRTQYDYKGLLAAIQAEYQGLHVTKVNVDMGQLAPVSDTMRVCQLKRDLGTLVRMHFVVNGVKQELFCN
jgi:hypothetical protein